MKKSVLAVFIVALATAVFSGCSSVRDFGDGIYRYEGDGRVYITVSECKDTPEDPEFDKECKIRFSDTYDFSDMTKSLKELALYLHFYKMGNLLETMSNAEYNALVRECEEKFDKSVDLKKQFCDNTCTFKYVQEEGEVVATLYTEVENGNCLDEDTVIPIIIDTDENGSLLVSYGTTKVFK